MIQKVKNIGHFIVTAGAQAVLGFPGRKLTLIAVTGTDGKTTTVHLVDAIFRAARKKSAYISSIHAKIDSQTIETGLHTTTPYHFDLPKLLRRMVGAGVTHGVVEVTSHALDQHRIAGLRFAVGVYTNISHEHLDYHGTFAQYLATKKRLMGFCSHVVLNRDDASYVPLSHEGRSRGLPMTSYGIAHAADVQAINVQTVASGTRFTIKLANGRIAVTSRLVGKYNVENMLAATAAAYVLGIDHRSIKQGLEELRPLSGRMEAIPSNTHIDVIVDFAHTPNALEQLLTQMRTLTRGKMVVVFGSAGERDTEKRPKMGQIAGRLADEIVITAEDPRSESVEKIAAEIAEGAVRAGCIKDKTFFMIPDRRAAIRFAIQKRARPGDLVVIAGKGHERSMCFRTKEIPWSDQDEAHQALRERR